MAEDGRRRRHPTLRKPPLPSSSWDYLTDPGSWMCPERGTVRRLCVPGRLPMTKVPALDEDFQTVAVLRISAAVESSMHIEDLPTGSATH